MEKQFKYRDKIYTVNINKQSDNILGSVNGKDIQFSLQSVSNTEHILRQENKQSHLFVAKNTSGQTFVHYNGAVYCLTQLEDDPDVEESDSGSSKDGKIVVQMPGKIIKVLVNEGDTVTKGQPLIIIESMKMENTQESPFDGKILEVNAEAGQQIDAGTMLMCLEPEDKPEDK